MSPHAKIESAKIDLENLLRRINKLFLHLWLSLSKTKKKIVSVQNPAQLELLYSVIIFPRRKIAVAQGYCSQPSTKETL